MDSEAAAFSTLLRRFRLAAGMSQEALAARSGLSTDAIAALERGRRTRPRAFTLGVLADALGLGADDRSRLLSALAYRAEPRGSPARTLPRRLTSFVGRQRELAEVERMLGEARLVTLTGPGGTGKTRLALAAAESRRGDCWFVALDACPEPALVTRAVASAVGAREAPGSSIAESLHRYAAGLDGLLVLDNCEHVAAAAADIAHDLLSVAPQLRLLATSREVLRVPGEMTWQVPALPDVDAIQLFADRAALAVPGFTINSDNADAVSRVCRLLDGIPLAIELAAARSRALTPAQLAERLDDAFTVLTSGVRTDPARHQTLRATVDWSYQLLEPAERRLFGQLSVFAGGFSLEAAEHVWGGPVLEPLGALVDRSLVLAEANDEGMRYRLLEVLRQYGLARLAEAGEEDEARLRHAEHCLEQAQWLPQGLQDRGDNRRWLPRFRNERANFDTALHWAAERGGAAGQTGAALAYALVPFWLADGSINEGAARLQMALAWAQGILRADILHTLASFTFRRGDYSLAVALMQESADIRRSAGDEDGMPGELNLLGLFRVCASEPGGAAVLAQALATLVGRGDERGAAESSLFLGFAAVADDDLASADQRFEVAAEIYSATGDYARLIACRGSQCFLRLEAGNLAEAGRIWAEIQAAVAGPLHGMNEEAGWLWAAMLVADAHGQDQTALRLLGAIEAWDRRGLRFIEPLRRRYQPLADRIKAQADPAMRAALMAEGAAMSAAELVALPVIPAGQRG